MKPLSKLLLILTVAAMGMCAYAQALPDNESSPARRIGIRVADNKSVYTTVNERNNYENLLQLQQPEGPYQLTAGMLNEGNNRIIFHRIDDQDIDTAIARINLNAHIVEKTMTIVDMYDFTTRVPQTETTVTQAMLSGGWGTDGTNLIWQTNGSAYVSGQGGLTFTVPAGYNNAVMQLIAYVGSSIGGGYFTVKYNDSNWSVAAQVTAGQAVVVKTFTGVNSGDVISIYGATYNSNDQSYYFSYSPDIELIAVREVPPTFIPTIEVSPTISYNDGGTWSAEAPMGSKVVYSPNDTVNLYDLGTVQDVFFAETAQNEHSSYYNYAVEYDANISLPFGDATGLDFYASADFTAATSGPATAAFIGPNNWSFSSTNVYNPTAGTCCYMLAYGSIIYTMPRSFMGNTVNVTVTSSTGEGAGDMYVNGIVHTFAAGETFTWTLPITANGIIEFKGNAIGSYTNSFSIDFTSIVISSGNGAATNAPVYHGEDVQDRMTVTGLKHHDRPIIENNEKCNETIMVK